MPVSRIFVIFAEKTLRMKAVIDYDGGVGASRTLSLEGCGLNFHLVHRGDRTEGLGTRGIYALLGTEAADGRRSLYIGKSCDVARRLAEHNRSKEFWTEAFACTHPDMTLDMLARLEAIAITVAVEDGMYELMDNIQIPDVVVPGATEAWCSTAFRWICDACEVLGLRIFSRRGADFTAGNRKGMLERVAKAAYSADDGDDDGVDTYIYNDLLRGMRVTGYQMTNGRFIVFKGSEVDGAVLDGDMVFDDISEATMRITGGSDEKKWRIVHE